MLKLQKLFMVVIILGSAYCVLASRDVFPFSNYPMYSKRFEPVDEYVFRNVRGVRPDGSEVPLQITRYLWPFWISSFREALFVDPRKEVVERKMISALKLYNERAMGLGGETLKAMRLYRYKANWQDVVENQKARKDFQDIPIKVEEIILEVSL